MHRMCLRFPRMDLAEEVRTIAEAMHDPRARRTMFLTAVGCERMAKHLERAAQHLSRPITRSPRLSA
jgi:hypothetical protein